MRNQIILLLLLLPLLAAAQPDSALISGGNGSPGFAIQGMYQNGYVLGTNKFLKGINAEAVKINSFQAFSLKFSVQTTGKNAWQQSYNYPQYGLGLYLADFFRHKEVGVPVAVFGFFNAPFKRWKKLVFNYEIGFGATFNWRSYNPVTNQYNVAIGAGESFMIDAGLNLQYLVTRRLELSAGFSLTHFSNGALKEPNSGFNTIAPKISVRYNFFDQPDFIKRDIPRFRPCSEWLFSAYGGVKNVVFDTVSLPLLEKYEGVWFPVFGVSVVFNRQLNHKSKIGMGVNTGYDGAINAQAAVEANEVDSDGGKFTDKIMISIYPSYELVIHHVSILIQPAFYLYRKQVVHQSPVFHQRVGLKYHITEHLFLGITLVAYKFHVSDFIEWNIGYRL